MKKVFKGLNYNGIKFYKGTLDDLLSKHQPVILDHTGEELKENFSQFHSFLIGDQTGYSSEFVESFKKHKIISLGNVEYLSSQTINILNFKLDIEEKSNSLETQ